MIPFPQGLLLVFLGGALGAVARVSLAGALAARIKGRPAARRLPPAAWGTLSVNWLGAFALGLVYALLPETARGPALFLAAGFLGSFTTVSSFALQGAEMLLERLQASALGYLLASALGAPLLALLGAGLGGFVFGAGL